MNADPESSRLPGAPAPAWFWAGCAVILVAAAALRGAPAVLFAGALAAIDPLLVAHSRMMSPDVPAALFCALALIGALRVLRSGAASAYVFGGLMTGLAAGMKYNAGLVGLGVAMGCLLRAPRDVSQLSRLVLAGAISIAVFLLTSPYMILDFANASRGILAEIRHYQTGHAGYEGDAWRVNLLWLWQAFGMALLLAPLAALHRARTDMLLIAGFVAAYFALLSAQVVRFDRNLMPIIPPLIVLIAGGFEVCAHARRWAMQPRARRVLYAAVAGVLLLPGVFGSLAETATRYRDTRKEARDWVNRHVAPGTSILVDSYGPYVDPKVYAVTVAHLVLLQPLSAMLAHDVVVVTRQGSGRLLVDERPSQREILKQLGARACERQEFKSDPAVTDFWIFRLRC
jgi:4-amino-4-deoxy-L-arabinose transferase-like glycosyltransferase